MPQLTGYDYFLENALKYGWLVPPGAIMAWKGTIATIPAGWVFCNGDNGTPDWRNVMLAGAQEDNGGVAKTNISGALTQSGGALGHTHTFTGNGHVHDFTGDGHEHYYVNSLYIDYGNQVNAVAYDDGLYSAAATGTTDMKSADGTTDNTNQLPPYKAVVWMMKT